MYTYFKQQHSTLSVPVPIPMQSNHPISPPSSSSSPQSCSQGHRSSLILQSEEGGSICLLCFTNLITNPNSPTFHVSYALSQLSHAVSQPSFLSPLLSFHTHLILSPLVHSLSSFDDEQIARQVIDVVSQISDYGGSSVAGDFVASVAAVLSSGELAWSRRQVYSLHCLGVFLTRQMDTYDSIKDKTGLINNLVMGLQLPSEEIRGEIMFVLYRICILQYSSEDEEGADILFEYCPMILQLSLDALMKTQRDDVRLNCLALLKVLGQRGFLSNAFSSEFNMMDTCEADNYTQSSNDEPNGSSLSRLFAEAIKSPLLSPDSQVQVSTLDLIVHCLSCGNCSLKQIQVLVEENLADYIFEILRLSEYKDQIVSSCVQALDILSAAEHVFRQRLSLGFSTLVSVLPQVAEVPFHPVQPQMLKLILVGISSYPGVVSAKLAEEISSSLTLILKRYSAGEMGMLPEAFITICSIFVALVKSPSASRASNLMATVLQASRHAILASLSTNDLNSYQLLHSLSLLKETYSFCHEISSICNSTEMQPRDSIIEVCQNHIVPWFMTEINGLEEESVLRILETLHFILLQAHDNQALQRTHALLSLSWFSLSFRCLGLYPTEKMKLTVYLMLSTIVDNILGDDSGKSIRTVASALPIDPVDLLFLLGQKHNLDLSSCQIAVLQILHISSLYDEMQVSNPALNFLDLLMSFKFSILTFRFFPIFLRLADKKLILTSLEQYMLANSSHLLFRAVDSIVVVYLLNLYALCRSFSKKNYQICYSSDAEKIFFELLEEQDWDLSSFDIHPSSLKWLFQQEKFSKSLSCQILKLSRNSFSNDTLMNCGILNFHDIACLASVGDNLLPKLLVLLLKQLVGNDMLLEDVISLLHFISSIITIFPHAADQLCMHGMGSAVQNLCSNLLCSSSLESYMIVSRFIFIILCSVQSQTLYDDEAWLAVVMKVGKFLCKSIQTWFHP
ncbi:protein PRD1-like [Chenopodium quinoa]|uniref:protein PRD1-like n=1 Tax=Chenopodium quinoa TaxID=63459 RepID=UPI000B7771AE|nr:protein PRD1-like [Chenopodium quinoa]